MIEVTIRDMPLEEYAQLGYRTINYYGTDYRIMCPVITDMEVDFVTTTKDLKWWGIKRGESISYAVPIIPLVGDCPTCGENDEDGEGSMNHKVGDVVRVVGNHNAHHFEIGELVTITKVSEEDGDYRADGKDGFWYIRDIDCESVVREEEKDDVE